MTTNQIASRRRPVIRVFVSSTFSDLKHERNVLQRDVFIRLEQLCAARRFQFQAIDLRWGVSAEAGLDHRAMRICFEELRRCQEVSPQPNFLILLGNRYGWRPLPEEISPDEFNSLDRALVQNEERNVLKCWYRKDENAIPPVFVLQSRRARQDDGKDYTLDDEWGKVESVLWRIINRAFAPNGLRGRFVTRTALNDPLPSIVRFQASATEQEIWRGALCSPDASGHVRAFVREIDNIADFKPAAQIKDFIDTDDEGVLDAGPQLGLKELKDKLARELGGDNVKSIGHARLEQLRDEHGTPKVNDKGEPVIDITTDHLQNLCDTVYAALEPIITGQINEHWTVSTPGESSQRELDRECDEHALFGQERAPTNAFVGRKAQLRTIRDYLCNDSHQPLVIHGASGCGKTALIAKAAQDAKVRAPVVRFLGATAHSSDLRSLLLSICEEIRLRYPREFALPVTTHELIRELHEQFKAATTEKPLVLFLDAMDQLANTDDGLQPNWIPFGPLPDHVKLIVSCLSDQSQDELAAQPFTALKRRGIAETQFINLDALSEEEAGALLFACWFPHANRRLNDVQRRDVEKRLQSESCRLPLYLKILFEEARLWRSYEPSPALGGSVPELLDALLGRLAAPANHGPTVECALGYIASGRRGLTETEILEVLYKDPDYQSFLAEMTKKTGQPLPDTPPRIPVVIWSRLRVDLAPYLAEQGAPGGTVLKFYHLQAAEYVRGHFLDTPVRRWQYHSKLASYFDKQDYFLESLEEQQARAKRQPPSPRPAHIRKVDELPWHRVRILETGGGESSNRNGDCDALERLLTDPSFLEAKTEGELVFDLAGDFGTALKALPEGRPKRRILHLLKEAIRRDIHFIARHARDYPQALFQCLWNSCWWHDCSEAAAHYRHRNCEPGEKLHVLLEQWREQREATHPGFVWLRSLRPPRVQLGTPLLLVIAGHEHEVTSVSFSSSGDRIVSGSGDYTVRVWDARNGRELACLRGHEDAVSGVAFSPGDDRIVSGSWDKTIRIWDASSGHELARLVGHEDVIRAVSISPDGKQIASAGGTPTKWGDGVNDYSIRVWDAADGRELACLRGHTHIVESVSFSPTGDRIVSGSRDKTVRIWDITNGQALACLCRHENEIRSVSFSPDGSRIVSGSDDGTVKVWDVASGREIFPIWAGPQSVRSVSFSPAGNLIVSASKDTTVRVWDARTGQEVGCLCGHGGAVNSVSFSPDGGQILSGSDDNTIRTWGVSNCRELAHLRGHTDTITDVRFSPTGDRIVSGAMDGTIRVWDAGSGRELACLDGGHGDGKTHFLSVWFSPDGTRIVSRASGDTVWVWDVGTGRNLVRIAPYERWDWAGVSLREFEHYCKLLFFSPDGERIATAADENTVRVWDVNTGLEFPSLRGHQRKVRGVSFSHAGDRVVTGSDDKTVRVWDVSTGQELARLRGHEGAVFRVSFSPDDRQIVSGSDDRTIRVWEIGNSREVICLRGHEGRVSSVSFSPDGSRVISALSDKTVRVWDVDTGQQLVCLSGHEAWVRSVSFSPSGDRIVSASNDGTVRVWDVGSGRELACLRGAGLWSLSMGREGMASERKDDIVRVWNADSFECLRMSDGDVDTTIRTMSFRAGGRKVETAIETLWPVREVAWFPAILNPTTACTARRPLVGTSVEYLYLLVLEGRISETGSPISIG